MKSTLTIKKGMSYGELFDAFEKDLGITLPRYSRAVMTLKLDLLGMGCSDTFGQKFESSVKTDEMTGSIAVTYLNETEREMELTIDKLVDPAVVKEVRELIQERPDQIHVERVGGRRRRW